ncbi:uncharacterized protein BDZ99DRAFT_523489 [Mytilinidion resinicola]|uniref:Uncharacterized protein n=1 Tax=Mytilinidion resinicola TaxID=574789 RepID=A0A6A6YDN0_9PEZI|nr:uncharacterized protein BDZ99DRAFT_523489 [Mytilinidion resinicola]KAF2806932.1 hypothetical protein BDZ99DRAFT_523489 [Mytilinidion resinicola]
MANTPPHSPPTKERPIEDASYANVYFYPIRAKTKNIHTLYRQRTNTSLEHHFQQTLPVSLPPLTKIVDPVTATLVAKGTGLSAKWGFSKSAALGLKKAGAKQVGHAVQNYGNMSVNAASQQSTAYGAGKSASESLGFFSAVASKLNSDAREPRYTSRGRDRDPLQGIPTTEQRRAARERQERQDRIETDRNREINQYYERKRARDHEAEMRGYERYQQQMAAQEARRRERRPEMGGEVRFERRVSPRIPRTSDH